jgi:thioredoxin-like negative regulator of GroEL
VDDIRAELATSPGDYSIQVRLAEALAATGEFREALEISLNLVIEDRARTGETARQLMIDLFQLPNIEAELAAEFQRKLSSALY